MKENCCGNAGLKQRPRSSQEKTGVCSDAASGLWMVVTERYHPDVTVKYDKKTFKERLAALKQPANLSFKRTPLRSYR